MRTPERLNECATCKWKEPTVCKECRRQKVIDDDLDKKREQKR